MEETEHLVEVMQRSKDYLLHKDSDNLRVLSNQFIHHVSSHQEEGCITLAILIYSLSKIIERRDYEGIKSWDKFVKKFNSSLDLAILATKENKIKEFDNYLQMARKALTSISVNLKPYIQEVLRKASINKASRVYEHGISMGRTARMLGITQWELSEYTGQRNIPDNPYNETIDVKIRAKTAMEFFS